MTEHRKEHRTRRSLLSCAIAVVLLLLTSANCATASDRETQLKKLLKDHSERLRPILVDLRTLTARALAGALKKYNALETRKQIDAGTRYRIHEWLVEELRSMRHPALATACKRVLAWTGKSSLPAQVVVLKTLLGPKYPARMEDRLEILDGILLTKRNALHRWAVHMLEDSKLPEAVDMLIDALQVVQARGGVDADTTLEDRLSLALYRLLGEHAISFSAKTIRKRWQELGRKIPRNPVYGRLRSGDTTYVVYFGDPVAAESLFLLDVSNSMKHMTTIRKPGANEKVHENPKIEIARNELLRALARLRGGFRFNVIAFNDVPRPWRGSTRASLQPATIGNLEGSLNFVKGLRGEGGTNIESALGLSVDSRDVEVVYLLSDGSPSETGSSGRVARHARMLNYLSGIRVVTLGLYNTDDDVYDERLMERLAQENWGWYRRLN